MSKIYEASDPHLGHNNIARHSGFYKARYQIDDERYKNVCYEQIDYKPVEVMTLFNNKT